MASKKPATYFFIVKEKLYTDTPPSFMGMYPVKEKERAEAYFITKCQVADTTARLYPNQKNLHWKPRFFTAEIDLEAEQRLTQIAATDDETDWAAKYRE